MYLKSIDPVLTLIRENSASGSLLYMDLIANCSIQLYWQPTESVQQRLQSSACQGFESGLWRINKNHHAGGEPLLLGVDPDQIEQYLKREE